MSRQEDGWPLGLRPLSASFGLARNRDFDGSLSFNTLLTSSPGSSTDSSSDLDTESTGSFFHDKSISLGSLIGVSSILELPQRSTRGKTTSEALRDQRKLKAKPWLFSLCSRLTTDAVNTNNTPLGHFLEAERRAAGTHVHRRNPSPTSCEPNGFSPVLQNSDLNSLVVSGQVAAPQSSTSLGIDGGRRSSTVLFGDGQGYGAPLLFPCLCGQLIE